MKYKIGELAKLLIFLPTQYGGMKIRDIFMQYGTKTADTVTMMKMVCLT